MPNIKISALPTAVLPLDLPNTFFEVQTVEVGIDVSRKVTAEELVGSISGLDATFITVNANASLPNERILTEGQFISIADAGAGNPITISVSAALAWANLSDVDIEQAQTGSFIYSIDGTDWEDTGGGLLWDDIAGELLNLFTYVALGGIALRNTNGDIFLDNVLLGGGQFQYTVAVGGNDFMRLRDDGLASFGQSGGSQNTTLQSGAEVDIVRNGVDQVALTLAPAAGGLSVNNTLTGVGLERVLTASDAIVAASTAADRTLRGDGSGGWAESPHVRITFSGILQIHGSAFTNTFLFTNNNTDAIINTVGLTDLNIGSGFTNIRSEVPLAILEAAAAPGDLATYGQFWVRNDVPNTPMFTDDVGTDFVLNAAGADPTQLVDGSANVAVIAEGSGITAIRSVGNIDAEGRELEWQLANGTTRFSIGNEFFTDMVLRNHITGRNIIFNVGIGGGSRIRLHLDGNQTTGGVTLYAGSSAVGRLATSNEGVRIQNGTLFLAEQAAAEANDASFGQLFVDSADDALHYITEVGVDFNLSAGVFDPTLDQTISGHWEFTDVQGVDFGPSCELDLRNNADDSSVFIQNLGPVFQFGIAGGDFGDGVFQISQTSFARVECPVIFIGEQAASEADITGDGQLWVRSSAVRQSFLFTNEDGDEYQLSPQSEAYKVAQTNRNTTIVLADDPNLAGFQLEASTAYMVEGWISGDQNVGGFRCAFTVSGAASEFTVTYAGVDSAGNEISLHRNSATGGALFAGFADPSTFGITIRGIIVTTGAVTVDFQWAQETSSANDTGVDEGSWIRFTKVTVQP